METDPNYQATAAMLVNRVRKNRRRLAPWASREQISCYRLYDRDIPEIPLAVDWYDGRLHIALYERASLPEAQRENWIGHLADALGQALNVPFRNIYIKLRRRAEGGTQYSPLDSRKELIEVQESGLTFLVNLSDYVDTGLFLDHRILRRTVQNESRNKRFLNLFAYTGTFSVYAAAGGAASTVTVDLSNTYLEWAEKNMHRNGFVGAAHRFVKDDILSAFENDRVSGTYDLVVIDPPTVSKSKSMARDLDIQRDHVALLNSALRRTAPGGTVFFSNNLKKFKIDRSRIECDDIRDITDKTRPFDFHSPFVHHSFRLTKDR